jgi:protein Hikeshi
MDAPESDSSSMGVGGGGDITLGISLEPSDSVTAQITALHTQTQPPPPSTSSTSALVPINHRGVTGSKMDTVVLAQRIIKNAFNFLASFSGNLDGGVEVVPLKAFEEWWRKFEGRVRADPGFLERDGD